MTLGQQPENIMFTILEYLENNTLYLLQIFVTHVLLNVYMFEYLTLELNCKKWIFKKLKIH